MHVFLWVFRTFQNSFVGTALNSGFCSHQEKTVLSATIHYISLFPTGPRYILKKCFDQVSIWGGKYKLEWPILGCSLLAGHGYFQINEKNIEKRSILRLSIEKSFLIDALTINNEMHRDSLILKCLILWSSYWFWVSGSD